MCGIAGLISANSAARIGAMLTSLEHRGRDDEGTWTAPAAAHERAEALGVTLGHRRLAIIDITSAGHQPMLSPDKRFALTFNGEIYNYRELRRQLETKHHRFQTDTDTEVLLAAFIEWGIECLPRLNGMFAFAVWDSLTSSLTLARDRLGIKPLYYAHIQNGARESFVFASEIKAEFAIVIDFAVEGKRETLVR